MPAVAFSPETPGVDRWSNSASVACPVSTGWADLLFLRLTSPVLFSNVLACACRIRTGRQDLTERHDAVLSKIDVLKQVVESLQYQKELLRVDEQKVRQRVSTERVPKTESEPR